MTAISPEIHDDVLNIARKRHQSGQMCQEVLNLLSKGEVTISMSLDEEKPRGRLPIPLIYRSLRKLMYGVLFGSKLASTENESDDEEKEVNEETKNTKIEETEKAKDDGVAEENGDKVYTSDKNVNVVENTEVVSNVNEKKEDSLTSETSEESSAKDENDDTKAVLVNGDTKVVIENGDRVAEETDDRFFVKEWCVYGDKDVKVPDKVYPKGINQLFYNFIIKVLIFIYSFKKLKL